VEHRIRIRRTFVVLNFCLYLGLILAVWAVPSGPFVLVLMHPDAGPDEAISAIDKAGGAFVSEGRFPWMAVGHSDSADFSARLVDAGALLVVNHQLALGCLKGSEG
jgi:hypothetical protein